MKILQSLKFAAGLGSYIVAGKVTTNHAVKITAGFGGITLVDRLDKFVEKKRDERKMRAITDDIDDEMSSMLTEILSEKDDDDDDDSDSDVEFELDIPMTEDDKKVIFPEADIEDDNADDDDNYCPVYDDIDDIRVNQQRPSDNDPIHFVDEHKMRRANRIKTNQAKKRLGGGKRNSRFDDWE